MNVTADDNELRVASAYAALAQGNAASAEADCRRALASAPDHPGALALIGFIEISQGRFGEALPVFDRLCGLEPSERSHWVNFGNALRGAGNADDSLKAFARAAELGERSADF